MPRASQASYAAPNRRSTLNGWARTLSQILSGSAVDLTSAAAVCLEICRSEQDSMLGVQSCRAYAALRRAQGELASDLAVRAAVRELEAVQLTILESQRKPFGKVKQGGSLIIERKLLGLPESGPLEAKEINAAFRTAAQDAHPDHGGSADRFVTLMAARDALLSVKG